VTLEAERESRIRDWDYRMPLCKSCRFEVVKEHPELDLGWDGEQEGQCWRCHRIDKVLRCAGPMMGWAFCRSCGTLYTNVRGHTLLCCCGPSETACETFAASRVLDAP
jgi:hypothetical protein